MQSERRADIISALSGANFVAEISDNILRASIGDTVAAGASAGVMKLLDECSQIAANEGFEPRPAYMQRARSIFTTPGCPLMASMLRDIEKGAPTEGDHILGDLLGRGTGGDIPILLSTAYAHVKSYEARRAREASAR